MICLGGTTSLLVTLLPPRIYAAHELVELLSSCLNETAVALEAAVGAFTHGRPLHYLTRLELDPQIQDLVRTAYRKVQPCAL